MNSDTDLKLVNLKTNHAFGKELAGLERGRYAHFLSNACTAVSTAWLGARSASSGLEKDNDNTAQIVTRLRFRSNDMKLPQGYEPHEIPADYTGKLWIEGQVNRYGQACYEEGLAGVETINEMTAVADRHAHAMAMWLELVCSDYGGKFYDSALQALGEYRMAMNAIHERESPTFMGGPVLHPHIPAPRGFIAQPSIDGLVRTSTTNCNRHPDAPHGPDGDGCKCHSWAPGEAS